MRQVPSLTSNFTDTILFIMVPVRYGRDQVDIIIGGAFYCESHGGAICTGRHGYNISSSPQTPHFLRSNEIILGLTFGAFFLMRNQEQFPFSSTFQHIFYCGVASSVMDQFLVKQAQHNTHSKCQFHFHNGGVGNNGYRLKIFEVLRIFWPKSM